MLRKTLPFLIVFVCGFAVCALVLQSTGGLTVSLGPGASPRGREDIMRALREKPTTARGALTAGLAGTSAVADAVAKVEPAVVNIDIAGDARAGRGPFRYLQPGAGQEFAGEGSGILLSGDGYIVTNNHVVEPVAESEGNGELVVRLDNGREFDNVRIIGRDPQTDLAVIKIEGVRGLPAAKLGDSGKLRVGEWAIAVGNPLGFNSSVTLGIISALDRRGPRSGTADGLDRLIQTDAAINPGNSGGALANIDGEVIGINTAIATETGGNIGIGFAIPISQARRVIEQLVENGKVERAYLGVVYQTLDSIDRKTVPAGVRLPGDGVGAVIVSADGAGDAVLPGSPAERAGLRKWDVIRAIEGRPLRGLRDLRESVQARRVGERLRLSVWRAGRLLEMTVTLGRMPDPRSSRRAGR
jgi:serine protease Do